MDLTDKLVADFVKAAAPKQERKPEEYTINGVVQTVDNNGMATVLFDGATEATPCQTAVTIAQGDKVIVSVRDRQGVITSNISKTTINADYLEGGSAKFSGELQAATGTFAGSLSAATGTFAGSLSAARGTFSGDISAATGDFGGTVTVNWRTGAEKKTVKIGSGTTAPFVITEAGSDAAAQIFPDSISVSKNGGRMWAQLDIYNGPDWYLSDRRLKNRISDLGPELAKRLRPVSYHYTEDYRNRERYGFIAQEVSSIMPDAVTENKLGSLGLSYTQFIAPTLALAQENARQIEALKQEIAELKGVINELKHNSESSD